MRTSMWTHWGRVTHICVDNLTIIGSDNGLSPGRRQAIIWNNAGLLLIEPLGTNFSEISIGIQTFSFKKMHLNISSAKWRPFCLGLNVLKAITWISNYKPWILWDVKRSSDNDSTGFWPPGSLHTLGADGHFLCGLKFFALNIFCGEYL